MISGSVGQNGRNIPRDVETVQRLLNKHRSTPLRHLRVDGIAGDNTINAIKHFQSAKVKLRFPDGRVDPGGKTLRYLNRGSEREFIGGEQDGSSSDKSRYVSNLSGAKWWKANQARYPNRRGLEYLEGDFRDNASKFVEALRKAGATVSIGSTRRDKIRAHLMHYSWKVSRGDLRASEVPSVAGLDIQWDHGDEKASRKAAGEMVRLFNMAHIASLSSNHIRGTAIDMTISWKGDLIIEVPGKDNPAVIRTGPRTGAGNRQLHRIGRSFGVYKLLKDPPHWSHNGR
jgi:hypothetical protein